MTARNTLTVERLREVLDYAPGTGIFTWKPRVETGRGATIFNKRFAGKQAGCPDAYGYIQLSIDRGRYKAHRLAWPLARGPIPAASQRPAISCGFGSRADVVRDPAA